MSYRPQLKGLGEKSWSNNGLYFATEAEAISWAEDRQSLWGGCEKGEANRRAVQSDKPVNYVWKDGWLVPVEVSTTG